MSIDTNPLVNFRRPQQLGGGHFDTKREDVVNDIGALSIYQGDFKYRLNPSLEIDLALWEDTGSTQSFAQYMKMTGQDGFNVAMAEEWDVATRLQLAWKSDGAKRLTFGGMSTNTMVLMWRTGESADKSSARSLKWSNEVNKTAEDRAAELQDKLGPLNASVSVTLEDDDDDDPKPARKRRG
jgi:hypothetical protein